ncbi:YfhO family protein [Streptomyces noursei]|uniref:YfhO family protein n=1 Tax=Streptomyces noursei TaxID=1971 RepID=UPI001F3E49E2|nr:YfhO family protein [Streptomyces noursei]
MRLTAGGHDLTARLRPGRAGSAVLALPAVSGWGCSVDGGPPRAPGAFGGLLAVPLGPGATRLHCAYAPPGLAAGLVASGAGAGAVGAVAGAAAVRRRRPRTAPPTCPAHSTPLPK